MLTEGRRGPVDKDRPLNVFVCVDDYLIKSATLMHITFDQRTDIYRSTLSHSCLQSIDTQIGQSHD